MSRSDLLQSDSLTVGDVWVERVTLDLRRDDREPAGGWPGTIREARARAYAHFTNDASVERYGVLTRDELERAVHAVYERARQRWLARARLDEETP